MSKYDMMKGSLQDSLYALQGTLEGMITTAQSDQILNAITIIDDYICVLNGLTRIISGLVEAGTADLESTPYEGLRLLKDKYQAKNRVFSRLLGEWWIVSSLQPALTGDVALEDWNAHNAFRRGNKISYGITYTFLSLRSKISSAFTDDRTIGDGRRVYVQNLILGTLEMVEECYMAIPHNGISRSRYDQLICDRWFMLVTTVWTIYETHLTGVNLAGSNGGERADEQMCVDERDSDLARFVMWERLKDTSALINRSISHDDSPSAQKLSSSSPFIVLTQTISVALCRSIVTLAFLCTDVDSVLALLAEATKETFATTAEEVGSLRHSVRIGKHLVSLNGVCTYLGGLPEAFPARTSKELGRENGCRDGKIIRDFVRLGGPPSKGFAPRSGLRSDLPPIIDSKLSISVLALLADMNVSVSIDWLINVIKMRRELLGDCTNNAFPPFSDEEIEARKKMGCVLSDLESEKERKGPGWLVWTARAHDHACVCQACLTLAMSQAGHTN